MYDYKFTKVQALYPEDFQRRINFCEMVLTKLEGDPMFFNKIIWTDESKFTRHGLFNRRHEHYHYTIKEIAFQKKNCFNIFCLIMDHKLKFFIYDEHLNSEKYFEILKNIEEHFFGLITSFTIPKLLVST